MNGPNNIKKESERIAFALSLIKRENEIREKLGIVYLEN